MERELWTALYALARQLERRDERGVYPVASIVGVWLWAVIHDRPVCWACLPSNWPQQPFRTLPSQPTVSRRMRSAAVRELLQRMMMALREPQVDWVKIVDAKPLPVGGCSKDPDARWGRGAKHLIKGYKLYAIWGRDALPIAWDVAPAQTSEQHMSERMIPGLSGGGYLLGDKLYDINKLYDAAANAGHQLLAARKRPHGGLGHRRHSRHRLRCLELLQTSFGQNLYAHRGQIEQRFAQLTNFAGGLAPLPNWVRRLHRVKLWLTGKLLIYAVRSRKIHAPTQTATA
jgi:hypothetical protein